MIGPLSSLPDGAPIAVDIAVVGAGAAGITLALELASSGLTVAVFEGGGTDPDPVSQARYEGPLTVGDGLDYPPLEAWRLRMLGGTTNHWGGWCRQLEDNVFSPREGRFDIGWPFEKTELDSAYARAAELCQIGRDEWDAANLCNEAGVPQPFEPTGVLTTPVWRYSPPTKFGTEYRDELERSDVSVYLGANLVGITASGVRVDELTFVADGNRTYTVRPNQVVLACGTIENVRQLLMLAPSVPKLAENGLLGAAFMEHPHVPVGYTLVDRTDLAEGGRLRAATSELRDTDGTLFKVGLGITPASLETWGMSNVSYTLLEVTDAITGLPLQSGMTEMWTAARGTDVGLVQVYARCEQRVNLDSRIVLSTETDDLGLPRAGLDWRVTADDVRDIDTGRQLVAQELMRQGFGPTVIGKAEELPYRITGGGHQMGGTRMHTDAALGVVDAQLRTHALENLYVVGSSTFPTTCFSNPTLTIVAMAVRLAAALRARA